MTSAASRSGIRLVDLPTNVAEAARQFHTVRTGPVGVGWERRATEAAWRVAKALDAALVDHGTGGQGYGNEPGA